MKPRQANLQPKTFPATSTTRTETIRPTIQILTTCKSKLPFYSPFTHIVLHWTTDLWMATGVPQSQFCRAHCLGQPLPACVRALGQPLELSGSGPSPKDAHPCKDAWSSSSSPWAELIALHHLQLPFRPRLHQHWRCFRIFLIAILELLSLTARLRPQFSDPAHDLLDASVSSQPSDDIVPSRASCLPPRIATLRHPVFRPLPILDPSARQCRQPRIRFLVPPCQQNRLDPAPVPLEAVFHEPSPRRIPVQKGHRKDNG